MTDFDGIPTLTRMPGSDSVFSEDAYDPAEIAGMRSAAWILLATAGLTITALLFGSKSLPISALVDGFLGVQLLRLRHSWRSWAMFRAWIGIVLGLFIAVGGLAGPAPLAGLALGVGQVTYSASLLLLLFGIPTMKRVILGRIVFGVSLVFMIAGIVIAAVTVPAAVATQ
jgi:hypothetical protein